MLYDEQRVTNFMTNLDATGSTKHRKAVMREVIGNKSWINVCGFYAKIGDFPPLLNETPEPFRKVHCTDLTPRQLPFMRRAVINYVMCPDATTEEEIDKWYAYFYPTFTQQVKNFLKGLTKLGRKQENITHG
jgi:hypothetical protein